MHDRTSRAAVLLSYAAFVFVGVNAAVTAVLLPAQMRDYGVDMATIGATFVTFSAGFLLAGAGAGDLAARLGTSGALVLGAGVYAATAVYVSSRPSFAAFLLVQVLLGAAIGVLEGVLNAHLSQLPGATTLLNRLHAFFGLGALLGPPFATRLLLTAEWTTVLLVLALACLPLLAGFTLLFPRRAGRQARLTAATVPTRAGTPGGHDAGPGDPAAGPGAAGAEGGRGLLGAALRQRAVLLASLFLTVYVGLEATVGNWGYTYLVDERSLAPLTAGYAVSGYWLGLTLGRFLISPAAARFRHTTEQMMAACLTGVVAATALTWLVPGTVAAGTGLLLLGFFLGPLFPTLMAVVPRLTTRRLVPTAIGVLNGLSVVGSAGLPWLAGAVAEGVGLWTLLPYALVLALAQALVWRAVAARTAPEPALRA